MVDPARPLHSGHDAGVTIVQIGERLLMAVADTTIDGTVSGRPKGRPIDSRAVLGRAFVRSRAVTLLDWAVALWIFSGSFVIFEPAPYELVFFGVLGVSLLAGIAFFRQLNGLLVLFVAFIPFA